MTFRNFYEEDITEGVSINLRHWVLTAEAQIHITSLAIECREYSGWTGDLVQDIDAVNIAKIYTDKPPIFSEIFAKMFGDFDEKLWSQKLARAFARKITDMINNEDS